MGKIEAPYGVELGRALVARSLNTLAFECRCIRTRFVALLAAYRQRVCLSRVPCWHGASTLSIRHRIYETDHLVGDPEGFIDYECSALKDGHEVFRIVQVSIEGGQPCHIGAVEISLCDVDVGDIETLLF
jgi:hypothetical protein